MYIDISMVYTLSIVNRKTNGSNPYIRIYKLTDLNFHLYFCRSSAIECIEASESSCTLVEELTPVEFPDRHPLSSFDSNYGIPVNGSRNGFQNELDESLVLREDNPSVNVTESTATVSSPPILGLNSHNSNFMSKRRERLQTVRAHFYTLYAAAIGFQFKNVNDNGSGGLGSLIGNFATKVGIRSAHRHMS